MELMKWNFVGDLPFFLGGKWGRFVPENSREGFSQRTSAKFKLSLRVKVPLCKGFYSFCV